MRASQRPGASTSAGVGSCSSPSQRRRRPSSPSRSSTPRDEGAAPVVGGLGELEPEEPLDEAVGGGRLDPPAAERLGEHRVVGDELAADDVDDVVDHADHHGHDRLERGRSASCSGEVMAPRITSGEPIASCRLASAAGSARSISPMRSSSADGSLRKLDT